MSPRAGCSGVRDDALVKWSSPRNWFVRHAGHRPVPAQSHSDPLARASSIATHRGTTQSRTVTARGRARSACATGAVARVPNRCRAAGFSPATTRTCDARKHPPTSRCADRCQRARSMLVETLEADGTIAGATIRAANDPERVHRDSIDADETVCESRVVRGDSGAALVPGSATTRRDRRGGGAVRRYGLERGGAIAWRQLSDPSEDQAEAVGALFAARRTRRDQERRGRYRSATASGSGSNHNTNLLDDAERSESRELDCSGVRRSVSISRSFRARKQLSLSLSDLRSGRTVPGRCEPAAWTFRTIGSTADHWRAPRGYGDAQFSVGAGRDLDSSTRVVAVLSDHRWTDLEDPLLSRRPAGPDATTRLPLSLRPE